MKLLYTYIIYVWNLKFGVGGVIFCKVHSIKVKSWECSVNISTIYLSTVHFTPVSMWLNFLLRALCRRLLSDHHRLYLSAQAKVNYLQFISIVIIVQIIIICNKSNNHPHHHHGGRNKSQRTKSQMEIWYFARLIIILVLLGVIDRLTNQRGAGDVIALVNQVDYSEKIWR